MDTGEDEDRALVRRFQRGDSEALAVLVARHQDRLYRLAQMWCRDRQDASDAVQEVFLRSYDSFFRFRFKSSTKTWLIRVLRNVCREFNRKRQHDLLGDDTEELADPLGGADAGLDLATTREARVAVRALLATLSTRQHDVVLLRVFEELSVADTARIMGCAQGTVKALLHKALQALRVSHTQMYGDTRQSQIDVGE